MTYSIRFRHVFAFIFSAMVIIHPTITYANNTLVTQPLNVCYYTEFKPITYGKAEGFELDLLRAVAKYWHQPIQFYPVAVYQGIGYLPSKVNSHCEIVAAGMSPTTCRIENGAAFTTPTAYFQQSLLVRKADYETGRITSYHSFLNTKMKIGVVPGTTGESFAHIRAEEANLPNSVFVQYPSESALLPALRKGLIDAIARGEIGNEYQASLDPSFMTIAKKDFKEGFAFSVDGKNKKLVTDLNAAILKITDNNKINYAAWWKDHQVFMQRVSKLKTS